jgi:hypothetical protein
MSVENDQLKLDMAQATQSTDSARAYLYEGAGLGEMYGQWQIEV